jgi:hypothetical protein
MSGHTTGPVPVLATRLARLARPYCYPCDRDTARDARRLGA